jgi:hypothetical protein
MLSREAILSEPRISRKRKSPSQSGVEASSFGLMTGNERDLMERMISKDKISRAGIAALCIVDAGRQPVVHGDADVAALEAKNGTALERIVSAALAFNAVTSEALEEGKNAKGQEPFLRFTMELARQLHMTRAQLLANADSVELSLWQSLYMMENEERHLQDLASRADGAARSAAQNRGR